jgi:hypothetical protein
MKYIKLFVESNKYYDIISPECDFFETRSKESFLEKEKEVLTNLLQSKPKFCTYTFNGVKAHLCIEHRIGSYNLDDKIYCYNVDKYKDEWFKVTREVRNFRNNKIESTCVFKCDQLSGLINLFEDEYLFLEENNI